MCGRHPQKLPNQYGIPTVSLERVGEPVEVARVGGLGVTHLHLNTTTESKLAIPATRSGVGQLHL